MNDTKSLRDPAAQMLSLWMGQVVCSALHSPPKRLSAAFLIPLFLSLFVVDIGILTVHATPLFPDTDRFVLAAQNILLANGVQLSSGDIGSNSSLVIGEANVLNGNVFASVITIAANTELNGNASFNRLVLSPSSTIFGSRSTPLRWPVFQVPLVPNFPTGGQNLNVQHTQSLSPGDYGSITVMPTVALTLIPGAYNLKSLDLRSNSRLLFSGSTALRIKDSLAVNRAVVIAQTVNIPSTQLELDYRGWRPVTVGTDSSLSFRLLAPFSLVLLSAHVTLKGQIIAFGLTVGRKSLLTRQDVFSTRSDPTKVVVFQGSTFVANELIVVFKDGATPLDAQTVADLVAGTIVGSIPQPPMIKIQVPTNAQGLMSDVDLIARSANPLILDVLPNLVGQ